MEAREDDATLDLPLERAALGPVFLRFEPPGAAPPVAIPLRPGDALDIGSRGGVAIALEDRTVSARHCRVVHRGTRLEVIDLGSRNGLSLGGARIQRADVGLGASFEVGRTFVRVEPPPRDDGDDVDGEPLPGVIGSSLPMRRLASAVRRVAKLRLPVLVRGESGTGKDLVARAVHTLGPRARRPFVALNAAAIARELAESELFGHERGAFTGAMRDRRGAFREAHLGTLFLDEIAALPLEQQAKLLRVVEEGAVRPVGGESVVHVDVRLVAATCEPLEALVASRRFRADLHERLAVCVIHVPPLRARLEDLPALARHVLDASEVGDKRLSRGALHALTGYRYPGNVRELRNVVVQAAVRAGRVIQAEDVASVFAERAGRARRRLGPDEALRLFEDCGRNVSAAARRAELPRSTMRDLLRAARSGAVEPFRIGP
ncbi:MAG TPA: sigma 54-dependent Fis family transcriptional regulator [Minicystis sp.]|nr:sigma 54-dependent Fis family transcriptional regulator [Minicystis sp.]